MADHGNTGSEDAELPGPDEAIFGMYEASVVRLHQRNLFQGNGFVVYSKGGTKLIMTCEHVVRGLPVNSVVPAYFSENCGPKASARILFSDRDRDLALLRADGVHRPCEVVEFSDVPVTMGQDVVLLSFIDMDGAYMVQPATFLGKITEEPAVITPEPKLFEVVRGNYTSKPGTSGAPLFEATHMLAVGVHIRSKLAPKEAISVRTIRAVLQENCLRPNAPDINATIKDLLRPFAE